MYNYFIADVVSELNVITQTFSLKTTTTNKV